MGKKLGITGNEAIAEAMRQANPDVCAAFPITPATEIMPRFRKLAASDIERKKDNSSVTVADKAAEKALIARLVVP